jgi:LysR family nod box-dependent transcriptional activator
MRFKGLDLNLLVAFDTLLELRSVTRAAERLHLSQGAMSATLSRLRESFADEILIPRGKRMYPTAFAQNLVPQVQACLRQIDEMWVTSSKFDPCHSQRVFRIVASDYITTVVLVPLIARLALSAPGVRTEILSLSDMELSQIENGDVDLLITPSDYVAPDLPTELLFEENHVVVGWKGNPALREGLTEAAFFAAGHVSVVFGNQRTLAFSDRMLENLGKARRVEVIAPSFTVLPWLLLGSPRLAIMQERLARAMTERFDIAYVPLPCPIPPMREMIQYHFTRSADAGLSWFREQLHAAAASWNLKD